MRLARYRHEDADAVGAVVDDSIIPLPGVTSVLEVPSELPDGPRLSLEQVRLLAPIPRPPKFLAAGLNFEDHLEETGMARPASPVFFNKQTTCVVGPGDDVHRPRVSELLDYEGELGVVIGRRCRHVPVEAAFDVIAGYLIVNDVSVRDWQLSSPTMTLGKSFDTHGPIGPWLTTADEIADPHDLGIRTWLNEQLVQDGSTRSMIFDIPTQIARLSAAFTLEPGDIIATGTPAGVGLVRQPPLWMKAGDTVRVEIDGLGVLENHIVEEPSDTAIR
ncbi:MAG TPA: fumarylacetoacetate hydrolase family protein [Microthrixaceae bacterium]|nr:fumarylacetoacetate hydrolase family protein [Microthrixaceae bacterium]